MKDPIEVVREMWDAFARGDGRASLEAFHPDVEWDGRNIPDGVLGRGRQVVLDHARHWSSIWDDWTVEVEKLVQVTPDTVVTYIRERGHSEGGITMDERHAEAYVVRDGLIIRRVGFSDPDGGASCRAVMVGRLALLD